MHKRNFLAAMIVTLLFASATQSNNEAIAAEPGWSPVIVATGSYRQQIQSTPIELRPYRPFHFYGNAVRRRYYQRQSYQGQAYSRPSNMAAPRTQVVLPYTYYRGY
ncbi:hypothetical protein Q31b_05720 [Novipirellula aureliae]|uniref:Uncharacterized protein n=1 Tax=Novipirellula aureliae TaxID=2527966 RepID=A0A5C6E9H0_9BACT|nr:hypothetical protein [Novipirellula aureliae]TWU45400.1 hypothetical protein Q31b_05720 [Novipirellula aureliae]